MPNGKRFDYAAYQAAKSKKDMAKADAKTNPNAAAKKGDIIAITDGE